MNDGSVSAHPHVVGDSFAPGAPIAACGYAPAGEAPAHSMRWRDRHSGGVGVSGERYIAWTSSSSCTVGPTTAMPRASIDRQLRV